MVEDCAEGQGLGFIASASVSFSNLAHQAREVFEEDGLVQQVLVGGQDLVQGNGKVQRVVQFFLACDDGGLVRGAFSIPAHRIRATVQSPGQVVNLLGIQRGPRVPCRVQNVSNSLQVRKGLISLVDDWRPRTRAALNLLLEFALKPDGSGRRHGWAVSRVGGGRRQGG